MPQKCLAQFLVWSAHLAGDRWCNWSSSDTNNGYYQSVLVLSLIEFAFSLRSSFNSALGYLYQGGTLCILDLEGLLAFFSSKTVIFSIAQCQIALSSSSLIATHSTGSVILAKSFQHDDEGFKPMRLSESYQVSHCRPRAFCSSTITRNIKQAFY